MENPPSKKLFKNEGDGNDLNKVENSDIDRSDSRRKTIRKGGI